MRQGRDDSGKRDGGRPTRAAMLMLNVAGGARVCVPNDLAQMTPFVLLEQEDWFEDEIRFVRRWLRPGMHALDVGANVGVYAAAMAQAVGRDGRVWALEPAPATFALLERTAAANGFTQLTPRPLAVSDTAGEIAFAVGAHSEYNAIASPGTAAAGAVAVAATTLDRLATEPGWRAPDFIKLDVEGHEARAVEGGRGLLSAASPLVMFEIRAERGIDLSALEPLHALGYEFYRLLPGPLLLAPFDADGRLDEYQLNLFACKRGRAGELEAAGLLAARAAAPADAPRERWAGWARSMPYAAALAERWPARAGLLAGSDSRRYHEGLAAYACSRASASSAAERLGWLERSREGIAEALAARKTLPRLLSLARVAWERGERGAAVAALKEALPLLETDWTRIVDEPLLAPSPRFEQLDASARPDEWLRAATIERYVQLKAHSSFFADPADLALVESACRLSVCSPELRRRRQLMRIAMGLQAGPEPESALCGSSAENRNARFWCPGVK